ncbi:nucleotide exchange factor GrpE [Leekyejoonella antrihumi]|uniref:Protein GrpE n=1 Tax=Leekyejoonella antrihumi TaxID=1660198 RepID=A0A563EBD5_9MICO|nr:nucleotide exchange factor GrpE [Leekyejoonella antrihumi]
MIRDKRRIDPETGARRDSPEAQGDSKPSTQQADASADAEPTAAAAGSAPAGGEQADLHPDTALASERLADLQRLQAEYINYKKRVDRDREKQREFVVGSVVESLLPVLDDIQLAKQHGDLEGTPFEKIADKLQGALGKHGLESFGAVGDPFDPNHHEALMHIEAEVPEGAESTTVVQVMQSGYRLGERMLRPARVAVADPK